MILGGNFLRRAFSEGLWEAFEDMKKVGPDTLKIGPNSIDVSLDNRWMWLEPTSPVRVVDPFDSKSLKSRQEIAPYIILFPNDFVLASTRECFETNEPLDYFGAYGLGPLQFKQDIDGRSTMGRLGVACHVTAGYGDFGFSGTWTLELKNLSAYPVKLYAGMRIAQVSLVAVLGADFYQGVYSEQNGPRAPRLGAERF